MLGKIMIFWESYIYHLYVVEGLGQIQSWRINMDLTSTNKPPI